MLVLVFSILLLLLLKIQSPRNVEIYPRIMAETKLIPGTKFITLAIGKLDDPISLLILPSMFARAGQVT